MPVAITPPFVLLSASKKLRAISMTSHKVPQRIGLLALSVALTLVGQPVYAQSNNLPPLTMSGNRLPNLGDGIEIPLGVERRLGENIAREIYRDPDYIDDPVLGDYVQSFWQVLLNAARQRGEQIGRAHV